MNNQQQQPQQPVRPPANSSTGNITSTSKFTVTSAWNATNMMTPEERQKEISRELLMQKIRARAPYQRKWPELAKALRGNIVERRYPLDAVEKSNLQKCLDMMQHCIRVNTRKGLVERLESLSRQLGLKFMADNNLLFISTDMFYVEIILTTESELVQAVKVHHECLNEQQSCQFLVETLRNGDFSDFTVQLEGFSSIYQINAEPNIKKQAFLCMQSLEADITTLYEMQKLGNTTDDHLRESAVGIASERRGGHPMKITFFATPAQLIEADSDILNFPSIENFSFKTIGYYGTINLKASSSNKLQIVPIVNTIRNQQNGCEEPVYSPLTSVNSILLPATYVFRLNQPMIVCYDTLRRLIPNYFIVMHDNQPTSSEATLEDLQKANIVLPFMHLLVRHITNTKIDLSRGFHYNLFGKYFHRYYFNENSHLDLNAILITEIPFTEPSQVPLIISFLRKHAFLQSLIKSCTNQWDTLLPDLDDNTDVIEIDGVTYDILVIRLLNYNDRNFGTIEINFDFATNNDIRVEIYRNSQRQLDKEEKMKRIIKSSMSIPLAVSEMYSLWNEEYLGRENHGEIIEEDDNEQMDYHPTPLPTIPSIPNVETAYDMLLNDQNAVDDDDDDDNDNDFLYIQQQQQQPPIRLLNDTNRVMANANARVGFNNKYQNENLQKEDFPEGPKSQLQATTTLTTVTAPAAAAAATTTTAIITADTPSTIEQEEQQQQQQQKQEIVGGVNSLGQIKNKIDEKEDDASIDDDKLLIKNLDRISNVNINLSPPPPTTTTTTSITQIQKEYEVNLVNIDQKFTTNYDIIDEIEDKSGRKRKLEDMGPPEPIILRQNSPNHDNIITSHIFSSPANIRSSPMQSPIYGSPKHSTTSSNNTSTTTISNSPKSPYSPKHNSTGKPSMQTLKSSLSPKNEKPSNTTDNLSIAGLQLHKTTTIATAVTATTTSGYNNNSNNNDLNGAIRKTSVSSGGAVGQYVF